jgi:paraquat-inducible protein B
MMKNLEDSILKAADRVPEIANDAARAMTQVRLVAEQIEAARLPDRANQTLTEADRALVELTTQLQGMDAQAVSAGALETLDKLNLLLARSEELMERLEGEEGLIRVSERGAVAIGDVARGARLVGPELELTLREVRGAARSVKRLADTLERDPDMLLKGRAQ